MNDFAAISTPWYHDQILRFDITLSGVNEQGSSAAMKIFGVEILNSSGGNSIDDAGNDQTATFVRLDQVPLVPHPQKPHARGRAEKAAMFPFSHPEEAYLSHGGRVSTASCGFWEGLSSRRFWDGVMTASQDSD